MGPIGPIFRSVQSWGPGTRTQGDDFSKKKGDSTYRKWWKTGLESWCIMVHHTGQVLLSPFFCLFILNQFVANGYEWLRNLDKLPPILMLTCHKYPAACSAKRYVRAVGTWRFRQELLCEADWVSQVVLVGARRERPAATEAISRLLPILVLPDLVLCFRFHHVFALV